MTIHRISVLTGLTMLFSVSAIGAASAARAQVEHWHDTSSEVIADFCGDLYVRRDYDIRGTTVIVPRGKARLEYFVDTSRGSLVTTNLVTNKSYREEFAQVIRDQSVVDNGDGTLTITVLGAGRYRTYDSNGALLFKDDGTVRWPILIDHGGTPTDHTDDEFLDFLGVVKESTGTNDLAGHDYCDDIRSFTS